MTGRAGAPGERAARTELRRFLRFNAVGLAGVAVQLAALAVLVHVCGVPYRGATLLALAATLVHNFLWHVRWTWSDRGMDRRGWLVAFVRFVSGNGLVSALGAAALMPMFVEVAGLPPVPANAVTIAICGVLNYGLASFAFIGSFRTAARRRSLPPEAA